MNKIFYVSPWVVLFLIGCENNFTERTRSPDKNVRYFKSFVSYDLPLRLCGEMTKEEVNALNGQYPDYEAGYDNNNETLPITITTSKRASKRIA
ncbi:MAG: hypothetical protein A2Y10_09225 [Planctomycetes bacterium GWF2_41_51]|nr:MAG: hypothetical protein A2Y10_09225 [Planctomycetes bacterium GWF2_41_51]HBG27852.1 hypothetical protein [Phycisphaerales bacterium]